MRHVLSEAHIPVTTPCSQCQRHCRGFVARAVPGPSKSKGDPLRHGHKHVEVKKNDSQMGMILVA